MAEDMDPVERWLRTLRLAGDPLSCATQEEANRRHRRIAARLDKTQRELRKSRRMGAGAGVDDDAEAQSVTTDVLSALPGDEQDGLSSISDQTSSIVAACQNQPLTRLDVFAMLRHLCLAETGLNAVPSSVAELVALEQLDLTGNRITTVAGDQLPSNLQILHLGANKIDSVAGLAHNGPPNLRHLGLAANPISTTHPLSTAPFAQNLWSLDLSYTDISDWAELQAVLSELSALSNFQALGTSLALHSNYRPWLLAHTGPATRTIDDIPLTRKDITWRATNPIVDVSDPPRVSLHLCKIQHLRRLPPLDADPNQEDDMAPSRHFLLVTRVPEDWTRLADPGTPAPPSGRPDRPNDKRDKSKAKPASAVALRVAEARQSALDEALGQWNVGIFGQGKPLHSGLQTWASLSAADPVVQHTLVPSSLKSLQTWLQDGAAVWILQATVTYSAAEDESQTVQAAIQLETLGLAHLDLWELGQGLASDYQAPELACYAAAPLAEAMSDRPVHLLLGPRAYPEPQPLMGRTAAAYAAEDEAAAALAAAQAQASKAKGKGGKLGGKSPAPVRATPRSTSKASKEREKDKDKGTDADDQKSANPPVAEPDVPVCIEVRASLVNA